jgi:hypothetical protein
LLIQRQRSLRPLVTDPTRTADRRRE